MYESRDLLTTRRRCICCHMRMALTGRRARGASTPPAPHGLPSRGEEPEKTATSRWSVLARPGFRRLFVADLISNVGDWVGLLAVVAVASRVAGCAELGVAAAVSSRIVPGPIQSAAPRLLSDRWDPRAHTLA